MLTGFQNARECAVREGRGEGGRLEQHRRPRRRMATAVGRGTPARSAQDMCPAADPHPPENVAGASAQLAGQTMPVEPLPLAVGHAVLETTAAK